MKIKISLTATWTRPATVCHISIVVSARPTSNQMLRLRVEIRRIRLRSCGSHADQIRLRNTTFAVWIGHCGHKVSMLTVCTTAARQARQPVYSRITVCAGDSLAISAVLCQLLRRMKSCKKSTQKFFGGLKLVCGHYEGPLREARHRQHILIFIFTHSDMYR